MGNQPPRTPAGRRRHRPPQEARVDPVTAPGPVAAPDPVVAPAASLPRHAAPRSAPRAGSAATQPPAGSPITDAGYAPTDPAAGYAAPLVALGHEVREDGALVVRWPHVEPDAGCVLYRVVSSEDHPPFSPDVGELVAETTGTEVVDSRPFRSAVRYVQVWANHGPDEASARAAQPVLVGSEVAVVPPADVELREDHGTVVGSWRVAAGVSHVDVLRVPSSASHQRGYQPRFLVSAGSDCRAGYHDTGCEAGESYEYRVYAVAVLPDGSQRLSEPVARAVRVPAPLTPVTDLVAVPRTTGGRLHVDLSWTPPRTGEVLIFRTPEGPRGRADEELQVETSALELAGLTSQYCLNHQPREEDGRSRLPDVAWPNGWPRVHFTPVSVDGDVARVGRTETLTRTSPVTRVELVQRFNYQFVTFAWPQGAASVHVHATAPGAGLPEQPGTPIGQIDRAGYEAYGGIRLSRPLPPQGCDVHLVPVSWYGGKPVPGEPVTQRYPGLLRLAYGFREEAGTGLLAGLRRAPGQRTVELRSDHDQPPPGASVGVVLVHRPDRLPLDQHDGEVLRRERCVIPAKAFIPIFDFRLDRGLTGYLRLFVEDTYEFGVPVALRERALSELRLG